MRAYKTGAAATALLIWLLVAAIAFADSIYVVQPGDTLYAIARRFGVTMQSIVQANNIVNPNFIYTSQQLVIPTAGGTSSGGTSTGGSSGGTSTGSGSSSSVYVVQAGDTLTRIAIRHQTSVLFLAAVNNLTDINRIFVGQVLTIPGGGTTTAPPPTPTSVPQQPAPTAVPTQAPAPTAVPTQPPPPPTATPVPPPTTPTGVNLLPNGSFENGWYNQDGVAELQMPNNWRLEWDTGATGFGTKSWDVYVRPEIRVLSKAYLPPNEHPLFIYDGDHTVKVFKGNGAISVRFLTDVTLDPGTYEYKINVFPDLVVSYENGSKVYAPDELSGDIRLIAAGGSTDWILPTFGQRNTFTYRFTINQRQTITIGTAIRGRFAIANNGWFIDNWSLQRLQ